MSRREDIRKSVSAAYTNAIREAVRPDRPTGGDCRKSSRVSCCGTADVSYGSLARLAGYEDRQLSGLSPEMMSSSFGCGNPVALANIRSGETVLDLGSGAGMDLLLAARIVGPEGRVIGVDMTSEMVERARENVARAGLNNVEIRAGLIEELPVDDGFVDLVISNCVINLSPEKNRVFNELVRVLKPGGRISISDIVVEDMPAWVVEIEHLYSACVSGAIPESEYIQGLKDAGLDGVGAVDRLVYSPDQLAALFGNGESGCCCGGSPLPGPELRRVTDALAGKVASVRFAGSKPVES